MQFHHTLCRSLPIAVVLFLGTTLVTITAGRETSASNPQEGKKKRNVAIVIHEGVELLDFAGPGEVFAAADGRQGFRVYTVAETSKSIVSQGFLSVNPQYTIENCPKPDIVVIPGGATRVLLDSPKMMDWVKTTAKDAEVMLSVCTGAFVFAKAGFLDDQEATTHYGSLDSLRASTLR